MQRKVDTLQLFLIKAPSKFDLPLHLVGVVEGKLSTKTINTECYLKAIWIEIVFIQCVEFVDLNGLRNGRIVFIN